MVVLVPPSREDLLPWMLRFLQDREHADGIRVLDEYGWDFRILGGLIERVRRVARAYLLLEKRGFSAEGRALVRSALEHAVTAQWAFLTPDGVDRLEVQLLQARVDYAKNSQDANDPKWVELIDRMKTQIPHDLNGSRRRGMPKFSGKGNVLESLDETGYLQRSYAVLSRAGHVTDQAVTDYFVEDGEVVAVASGPSDVHDIDVFHTLATSCCLAAWVLARMEGDARGLELATAQGLLWRLDTHLPAESRRFPAEVD
ncbi:DUF5677 domain-containing protein [Microbacterium azadirachtae]|uniref:DUF5677 domain-containing protein n=1 Tax=Microbacterium azadirachtae TaxID=582680 RepID=UPI000B881161|nr:DUF5677 domain-containing protein [Microbacterium azadirachtae]